MNYKTMKKAIKNITIAIMITISINSAATIKNINTENFKTISIHQPK